MPPVLDFQRCVRTTPGPSSARRDLPEQLEQPRRRQRLGPLGQVEITRRRQAHAGERRTELLATGSKELADEVAERLGVLEVAVDRSLR